MLTGGIAMGELALTNPSPDWITDKMWGEVCRLSDLPNDNWAEFSGSVKSRVVEWKRIYDSVEPQSEALPDSWDTQLDAFQKILVLR